MHSRVFETTDQIAFAKLSGDYNPMHVDGTAARRLMFGRMVVHGIHAVVWALDCWLAQHDRPIRLQTFSVHFRSPIAIGESVRVMVTDSRSGAETINICIGNTNCIEIEFTWDSPTSFPGDGQTLPRFGLTHPCVEHSTESLSDSSGEVDLFLDTPALLNLYPRLDRLPPWQIAILLATTRLVGTECPGLHSIFYKVSLDFKADCGGDMKLRYAVDRYDSRFGFLLIKIHSLGVSGAIQAFERPRPSQQASMSEARRLVEPGEFAHQRAVIVGGSRGMGETVAKLLVAGGADVRITYNQGQEDAERVVQELRPHCPASECFQLDVTDIGVDAFAALGDWRPTDFYYCATPYIQTTEEKRFSSSLYKRFSTYYVSGFVDCFYQLLQTELRRVFYPSSVFVDEKPSNLLEYVACKKVGETVCSSLQYIHPEVLFYHPRLPRMSTDQTTRFGPSTDQSSAPVMITHLRRLRHDMHRSEEMIAL